MIRSSMCVALLLVASLSRESVADYTFTIDSGPNIGVLLNGDFDIAFTFPSTPAPIGDGLLTVTADGDLENREPFPDVEAVDVFVESSSGTGGQFVGRLFSGPPPVGFPGVPFTDSIAIDQSVLLPLTVDDEVTFVLEPNNVVTDVRYYSLTLSYAVPEPSTFALLAVGMMAAGAGRGRRQRSIA